ncbi:MAG: hypothetical protein ACOX4Q_04265 [Syntrophomonadales bacterium]
MKVNVAFCPHFHQPHFQLHHTREEVFKNSYLPWIELLEGMAADPGFYINLHFSGPLLLWLAHEKPSYLERLRAMLRKDGFGLIGGLADEAFAQLSARPDDILFQVREYANISTRLLGVNALEWEGIHVVEREAGEWVLYNLAVAARLVGAAPLLYLDAETFFGPHFNYPGGQFDYCRKHFGFDDPHARTTVSHLPPEILFYGLRDEIGGQEFFVLPVHSEFRYRLLKRQSFGDGDRSIIKPRQYVFYLKDAAEKSIRMARRLGKDLEPVIVIFEDAEKFGQWSKDPRGDTAWLKEFFRLVLEDPELQFCGLRSYFERQGFLDTYPAATSRSYAEWENWTARRGIRGVTFGDERLRRAMARQRDLERRMQELDRLVLRDLELPGLSRLLLRDVVLDSPHRFKLIQELLSIRHSEEMVRAYRVIQRVRNLAYQEDPRWASRHPSYGSCAYFDLQGLAYLELAERLADLAIEKIKGQAGGLPVVEVRDWDMDGEDEVIVRTARQTVVVHVRKGQVVFHQGVSQQELGFAELLSYLEKEMLFPVAYSEVLAITHSLIFTETDSDLTEEFYPEGGRVERCRNSMGLTFATREDEKWVPLDQETPGYRLVSTETHGDKIVISLEASPSIIKDGECLRLRVRKTFHICEASLVMSVEVQVIDGECGELYLAPELVTSMVPSDERELQPVSWLGIEGETSEVNYEVLRPEIERGTYRSEINRCPRPGKLAYVCETVSGRGTASRNALFWEIASGQAIVRVVVEPAVKSYYRGHVFPTHSELSYDASGLLIRPYVAVTSGQVSFQAELSWCLGNGPERDEYSHFVQLV